MGMFMSLMGNGLPSSQMFNMLMGNLYQKFIESEMNNFEDFHRAFLDIFSIVNSALPGKHYDAPSRKDVEECYGKWRESPPEREKDVFMDFMKERMNLSKVDDATMMTGIVTPPAAMAAKKAGENVPQMRMIKAIPDVIFVPSITLIALISVKLSRKIIQRKRQPSIPEAAPPPPPCSMTSAVAPASPPSPQPAKKSFESRKEEASPPRSRASVAPASPPSPQPAKKSFESRKEEASLLWYSPPYQPGFPQKQQPQRWPRD